MPPRLPDHTRAAILADIRAGGTCRGIARKHGVSAATVRNIAQQAGITNAFERVQTENATRARVADMAADRAAKAAALLEDFDRLRARAWSRYEVVANTPQGPETVTLELPPLRDVQAAYTAMAICIDKHLAIERHDAAGGAESVGSLLGALFDEMVTRHGDAPAE